MPHVCFVAAVPLPAQRDHRLPEQGFITPRAVSHPASLLDIALKMVDIVHLADDRDDIARLKLVLRREVHHRLMARSIAMMLTLYLRRTSSS